MFSPTQENCHFIYTCDLCGGPSGLFGSLVGNTDSLAIDPQVEFSPGTHLYASPVIYGLATTRLQSSGVRTMHTHNCLHRYGTMETKTFSFKVGNVTQCGLQAKQYPNRIGIIF